MYYLMKWVSWVICQLPIRVRTSLGTGIGKLLWPLVPKRRREMAVANVMSALGVERIEAETIAKNSGVRFGRMFLELLYTPKVNRENVGDMVTVIGEEHIHEALSHGRGAILATAHTGNWELMGIWLALRGYPIVSVAQKQTNPAMDRFINEYRSMHGQKIVYKSGVRDMIKELSGNAIIGLLIDQDAGTQGQFVEFFGRQASAPAGAVALARLNGAPIMPMFITELSGGRHQVVVHPLVWLEKTEDRDRDFRTTLQAVYRIMEVHIRKHPNEWFWLHNRWKTSPPNNSKIDQ